MPAEQGFHLLPKHLETSESGFISHTLASCEDFGKLQKNSPTVTKTENTDLWRETRWRFGAHCVTRFHTVCGSSGSFAACVSPSCKSRRGSFHPVIIDRRHYWEQQTSLQGFVISERFEENSSGTSCLMLLDVSLKRFLFI